jgi:hypothetical protein
MTCGNWRQIGEIFDQALERDQAQRDAFVRQACRDDSDLRREIGLLARPISAREMNISLVRTVLLSI